MAEQKNKSSLNITGLTPVRTGRVISSLIALMGMVFLLLQRVLSAILSMANEGVAMGLARYSNFTGRMALQNFPEDRKLFKLLKDVEGLLPMADTALVVLMVIAVVFLVVALFGLAFPRHFVHVLVALKILKWRNSDCPNADENEDSLRESLKKMGDVPLKKLAIPFAVILAIVVGGLAISNCREKVQMSSTAGMVDEMQQQALAYITAQRNYFAKNKLVGGAKALQLQDSLSTDGFEYKITASRFVAVSKVPLGKCPAGSKWSVSATSKGVFTKELSLYRAVPKDSSCAALTPDYKNLGRNSTPNP